MADRKSQQDSSIRSALRRIFLSAFVVVSFAAYALHKPTGQTGSASAQGLPPDQGGPQTQQAPAASDTPTAAPTDAGAQAAQAAAPTDAGSTAAAPQPTPTDSPTAAASSGYKDGTYNGSQVDAFYGIVQVQAVIQQGKLASVNFLQYPNDRRTSVQINQIAVPDLQQEAVTAQSANVDIITGATLTSQAFAMSLQSALDQAKS